MALCRIAKEESLPSINAIHVNHQLHPDADAWADRCAEFCRHLGVDLTISVISVVDSGKGPEAAARQARYEVFESLLIPGDLLLMGHHQDDQAETLMLRLLRGAGPRGLSAIPESRVCGQGFLLRPLLHTPRSVIEAFAASESLRPITDSSNNDTPTTGTSFVMRFCPSWSNAGPSIVTALRGQLIDSVKRRHLCWIALKPHSFGAR